jgi:hypothetical protein
MFVAIVGLVADHAKQVLVRPHVMVAALVLAGCSGSGECEFGELKVRSYGGPAVTETSLICSDGEHWTCGNRGPDALIFVGDVSANGCESTEGERFMEFLYSTEAPSVVRWKLGFDGDGTLSYAAAQERDLDDLEPVLGGYMELVGGEPGGDGCAYGNVLLAMDDVIVEGHLLTQKCTY